MVKMKHVLNNMCNHRFLLDTIGNLVVLVHPRRIPGPSRAMVKQKKETVTAGKSKAAPQSRTTVGGGPKKKKPHGAAAASKKKPQHSAKNRRSLSLLPLQ